MLQSTSEQFSLQFWKINLVKFSRGIFYPFPWICRPFSSFYRLFISSFVFSISWLIFSLFTLEKWWLHVPISDWTVRPCGWECKGLSYEKTLSLAMHDIFCHHLINDISQLKTERREQQNMMGKNSTTWSRKTFFVCLHWCRIIKIIVLIVYFFDRTYFFKISS